jgi:hypothetical protein
MHQGDPLKGEYINREICKCAEEMVQAKIYKEAHI